MGKLNAKKFDVDDVYDTCLKSMFTSLVLAFNQMWLFTVIHSEQTGLVLGQRPIFYITKISLSNVISRTQVFPVSLFKKKTSVPVFENAVRSDLCLWHFGSSIFTSVSPVWYPARESLTGWRSVRCECVCRRVRAEGKIQAWESQQGQKAHEGIRKEVINPSGWNQYCTEKARSEKEESWEWQKLPPSWGYIRIQTTFRGGSLQGIRISA